MWNSFGSISIIFSLFFITISKNPSSVELNDTLITPEEMDHLALAEGCVLFQPF